MERDTLLRIFRALADEGVAYVLVGGLAVNLDGDPGTGTGDLP